MKVLSLTVLSLSLVSRSSGLSLGGSGQTNAATGGSSNQNLNVGVGGLDRRRLTVDDGKVLLIYGEVVIEVKQSEEGGIVTESLRTEYNSEDEPLIVRFACGSDGEGPEDLPEFREEALLLSNCTTRVDEASETCLFDVCTKNHDPSLPFLMCMLQDSDTELGLRLTRRLTYALVDKPEDNVCYRIVSDQIFDRAVAENSVVTFKETATEFRKEIQEDEVYRVADKMKNKRLVALEEEQAAKNNNGRRRRVLARTPSYYDTAEEEEDYPLDTYHLQDEAEHRRKLTSVYSYDIEVVHREWLGVRSPCSEVCEDTYSYYEG